MGVVRSHKDNKQSTSRFHFFFFLTMDVNDQNVLIFFLLLLQWMLQINQHEE